MAVEKMYFVNLARPLNELDSFVMNKIIPHEVHLEKTYTVMESTQGLSAFDGTNPYDILLKKATVLCKDLDIDTTIAQADVCDIIDFETVEQDLDEHLAVFDSLIAERKAFEALIAEKEQIKKQIIPIQGLDFEVDKLFKLQYMRFRFGKMPKEHYHKIQEFDKNLDLIVYEVFREGEEIFLIYLCPKPIRKQIDSLFASLYFKRIRISDEVKGYPKEALENINAEIVNLTQQLNNLNDRIGHFIVDHQERISKLFATVHKLHNVYTVRNYAVYSDRTAYLTGWVASSKLSDFVKDINASDAYAFTVNEDEDMTKVKPPTKLINPKLFKPFELIVGMYGTPSYDEMDPTIFVGLTYMLMFGAMFGDVGQGLLIALLGWAFYNKTKSSLGYIGIYLGISSMVAGLFYGSVFGNEEFLPNVMPWFPMINPMEHKNEVLLVTIGLGALLIIAAMLINLLNAIKKKDKGRLLFDKNGVVGLVAYFSILYIVLVKATKGTMTVIPAALLIGVSFLIIFLSHPLQTYLKTKKEFLPSDKTGFFIEALFELLETMLSILSNTISFMRVGAFALNHVGLIIAVHMLADMVGKSSGDFGSFMIMVIGNIVIVALEGLIVGIQCLRLEYYELFSRFFEGEGNEFKPFLCKKQRA